MTKILIIDDDPDMILALHLCLEDAGYEIVEAESGNEGLEKVKSENPDLIVLDAMMDTATEGFQVALTLRSSDPESEYAPYRQIPILMLTAIHTTTPLRFGPNEDYLPVDDFIEKPLEPDLLAQKVKELLSAGT
ncbi:MAG: response regulator [Anaerolineales bacterium]|nr:MAG: response regulator [Anaerolineales bacterium]